MATLTNIVENYVDRKIDEVRAQGEKLKLNLPRIVADCISYFSGDKRVEEAYLKIEDLIPHIRIKTNISDEDEYSEFSDQISDLDSELSKTYDISISFLSLRRDDDYFDVDWEEDAVRIYPD